MIMPVSTSDGSSTLHDPRTGEHYHSLHGAETESRHVFIQAGLAYAAEQFTDCLRVLEVGFGTGLNALLTWQFASTLKRSVRYTGLEPYPISSTVVKELVFPAFQLEISSSSESIPSGRSTDLSDEKKLKGNSITDKHNKYYADDSNSLPVDAYLSCWQNAFWGLHGIGDPNRYAKLTWQHLKSEKNDGLLSKNSLDSTHFSFTVLIQTLQEKELKQVYHVIYFDAFSPDTEPELWTPIIWNKLFACLVPGGLLVTYSAKGAVRRALQTAGFSVERLPGPPFKRHMLRASKPRHKA